MTAFIQQVVAEMKNHPITLLLVLLALGGTWMAHSTHARSEELNQHIAEDYAQDASLQLQLNLIMELQLADTLAKLRIQWCSAPSNGSTRTALNTAMQRYKAEYLKVTGHTYEQQACSEIV